MDADIEKTADGRAEKRRPDDLPSPDHADVVVKRSAATSSSNTPRVILRSRNDGHNMRWKHPVLLYRNYFNV